MKKKKILFIVLLLLIIAVPFSIVFGNFDKISFMNILKKSSASVTTDTSNYRYSNWGVSASEVFGGTIPGFCVNNGNDSCRGNITTFWMHEAMFGDEARFEHGYCLHMGKKADGDGRPNLTAYIYGEDGYESGAITNNSGNAISDSQLRLLEDFLAGTWHYTGHIYGVHNTQILQKVFVRQIIVWEIVEGGRTSFSYEPTYHDDNSAYKRVISANSSLLSYYKEALDEAQRFRNLRTDTNSSATLFGSDKIYPMNWDTNLGKYSTDYLPGLDGFGSCKSNNDSVDFSYSSDGKKLRVTSKTASPVPSNTVITCSKSYGDGTNTWAYYKFEGHSDWQDVINGTGNVRLSKSFSVYNEESKVYITKIDANDSQLDNWEFTLKFKNDQSIKYTISKSGNNQTMDTRINRSGEYLLDEVTPPYGYEKISQTILNINIKNKSITSSNPSQVQGRYNSSTNSFEIIVRDAKKTFEIKKVNENDQPLKGATFKVYNGSNFTNQVKFTHSGNDFVYAENGNVTDIVDSNYATYTLSLLPKGIYKIVETDVNPPYVIATAESERTKYISIDKDYNVFDCFNDSSCKNAKKTVSNSIKVMNYKTKVEINKIGLGGKPLEGVKFALYTSDKKYLINSNCTNGVCEYATTANSIEQATIYITDANGNLVIHNLPTGTYYLREIETIDPYVVPSGDDAYTKLVVEMTAGGPLLNGRMSYRETISNATKEFNFYKVDENGNYLSGGKFKIQKYNDETGKFEDIKISSVANDGTTYQKEADVFKEDSKGKVQFTLKNGIATFVEMSVNTTYRIVELEAPKGYQVANIDNSALITIDKNGFAKGSATIINQTRMLEGSTAQAELVIEIQTGQKVIRYGLIIGGTLIVIAGLMATLIYITKKRK